MASPEACILLNELPTADSPVPTRDFLVHLGAQIGRYLGASSVSIVARSAPTPSLAALGRLSEEDRTRLRRLSTRAQSMLRRLRYVTYEQVERDCEALAHRLSDRLECEVLHEAQFVGVPRGGQVVLGILSYVLNLDHAQIGPPVPVDRPVVVVDDCALTGSRARRFFNSEINLPANQDGEHEIVFAPLYAHPDLRSSVEEASPYVTVCVSAQDLHDYGPEDLGEEYSAWRTRWRERHPDERYWIGRTEHLCFPWGEVDTATWNPDREQVEQGLSVIPPKYRLKTRPSTDVSHQEASNSVQVQPNPAGPLRPASPVLFGQVDGDTIVANPDADICVELDGTAATMWHALVEHGTVDDTVEALCQTYSVDESTLRADLVDFIDRLTAHDLLHVPDGSLA